MKLQIYIHDEGSYKYYPNKFGPLYEPLRELLDKTDKECFYFDGKNGRALSVRHEEPTQEEPRGGTRKIAVQLSGEELDWCIRNPSCIYWLKVCLEGLRREEAKQLYNKDVKIKTIKEIKEGKMVDAASADQKTAQYLFAVAAQSAYDGRDYAGIAENDKELSVIMALMLLPVPMRRISIGLPCAGGDLYGVMNTDTLSGERAEDKAVSAIYRMQEAVMGSFDQSLRDGLAVWQIINAQLQRAQASEEDMRNHNEAMVAMDQQRLPEKQVVDTLYSCQELSRALEENDYGAAVRVIEQNRDAVLLLCTEEKAALEKLLLENQAQQPTESPQTEQPQESKKGTNVPSYTEKVVEAPQSKPARKLGLGYWVEKILNWGIVVLLAAGAVLLYLVSERAGEIVIHTNGKELLMLGIGMALGWALSNALGGGRRGPNE